MGSDVARMEQVIIIFFMDKPGILEFIESAEWVGDRSLSLLQKNCLKSVYGGRLTKNEQARIKHYTGKEELSLRGYNEADFIIGRKGGKSDKLASNIGIYEAVHGGHEKKLSVGERGYVVVIAQNLNTAQVVFRYIKAKLLRSPRMKPMIENVKAKEIDLTNGITIATIPCNNVAIRGLAVCCCICDEVGFWRSNKTGANPDYEIINAIKPAMATFDNPKLIKISSPYTKQGVLHDDFDKRRQHEDIIIWNVPTWEMNPSISKKFFEDEKKKDYHNFQREYGANFADSISVFLPPITINAAVAKGITRRQYQIGKSYFAAIDPAFKSDLFTFTIAHIEAGNRIQFDVIIGFKGSPSVPLNMEATIVRITETLKEFDIRKVSGDQYCAAPVKQQFAKHNVFYEQVSFTPATKREIYENLKSLFLSAKVELLDHPQSVAELKSVEKRLTALDNIQISKPKHGNTGDDYADVIALLAYKATPFLGKAVSEPVREMTREMAGYMIEKGEEARRQADSILGSEFFSDEEIEETIFDNLFGEAGPWPN